MIGILIISHEDLGCSLVQCATHVIGEKLKQVSVLSVFPHDNPEQVEVRALEMISEIDTGDGVLVLSDIYGATPCNIASQMIQPGKVECLAGVNLPMLLRALTYRNESFVDMVERTVSGGRNGILRVLREP